MLDALFADHSSCVYRTLEQLAALAVDNLRAQRATGNGAGDEANGAMNGTLPEERRKYDQILEVKIP